MVLPSTAWNDSNLVNALVELATNNYIGDELPPPVDGPEGET